MYNLNTWLSWENQVGTVNEILMKSILHFKLYCFVKKSEIASFWSFFLPPFISHIPFSLFHSNMNNFMLFLKLRNALELVISYSFAFFFVSVIIFSVYHS